MATISGEATRTDATLAAIVTILVTKSNSQGTYQTADYYASQYEVIRHLINVRTSIYFPLTSITAVVLQVTQML